MPPIRQRNCESRCAVLALSRSPVAGSVTRYATGSLDASFAALGGVNPIEASSGKTRRRRLNGGGDRRANTALYRIAPTRTRGEERTRDYLDRRIAEGRTRRKAIRCIKRYIAREIYQLIRQPDLTEQALRRA